MADLNKILNKLYVKELSARGGSDSYADNFKIANNMFTNMDANTRADLMKELDVYYEGTIRKKRAVCVTYILNNIINQSSLDDFNLFNFSDFKDLKDIKEDIKEDIEVLDTKIDIVDSVGSLGLEDTTYEFELNSIDNTNNSSTDEIDGLPIDVIETIIRYKDCGNLDGLYLDSSRNIVTCVKGNERKSIRLNDEDFINTRIVLDLLSIKYV